MPTDDFDVEIRLFDPALHDRTGFDCGVPRLNNYLKLTARKHQKADMTRVYVALRVGEASILGYHAINAGSMNVDAMAKRPRDMPAHGDVPVLFLGQIAVDGRAQGRGIGGILMHHVFRKAEAVATEIGCHALLLDVMSDGSDAAYARRIAWYEAYGFRPTASNPARLYMTIRDVRAALAP